MWRVKTFSEEGYITGLVQIWTELTVYSSVSGHQAVPVQGVQALSLAACEHRRVARPL